MNTIPTSGPAVLICALGSVFILAGCNSSEDSQPDAPLTYAASHKASSDPDAANDENSPGEITESSAHSPSTDTVAPDRESDPEEVQPESSAANGERKDWHALLVGCTKYHHLEPEASLRGPSNDVRLFRQILVDKFELLPERVTTLIEESDADHRPTRKNIQRELTRLENEAKQGESVLILLSGHGSQQPDNDPENPEDIEPDGLDEVFLPADITIPDDPTDLSIGNALTDDDLRETVTRFRKNGIFVLFISDSCHSGSSVRGLETYREIAPERFFTRKLLQQSRERAASVSTAPASSDLNSSSGLAGDYVAIYAAQPHEPTIELPLPPGGWLSAWRGLLSFTMSKILVESNEPITYRELVQRIHAEYVQSLGRLGPTPLIEGSGLDRIVFGADTKQRSSPFVLLKNEDEEWTIRAGQLHGLSRGAILAVWPPPGAARTKAPLGHVRVKEAQLSESIVKPVAFGEAAVSTSLPMGGVCELVQIERNPFTLKVAVESSGSSNELEQSIVEALKKENKETTLPIEVLDDPRNADWLIKINNEELALAPASEWREGSAQKVFTPSSGSDPVDWLRRTLSQISRASGLLKVSGIESARRKRLGTKTDSHSLCEVQVELTRMNDDSSPEPLKWEATGLNLEAGDVVTLKITNSGLAMIDFTALFVDSQYGISVLFPEPGLVADNRIEPGQEFTVGPLRVDASTAGLEHLVVIASPAQGQPLDWSWLAQPSLELSSNRSVSVSNSLNTSTGALLKNAMFANSSNRGLQKVEPDDITMEVISWTTNPSTAD